MSARLKIGNVLPGRGRGLARHLLVVGVMLTWLSGCGSSDLELAPAEGTVTLDGKPVANAGVMFQPVEGGPYALGTTDAKGHYRLVTANQPGAPVGDHRVVITKTEIRSRPRESVGATDDVQQREMTDIQETNYLPSRYSSPLTSELRAAIKPSGNNLTFSLTSDETVAAPADSVASPAESASPSDASEPSESSPRDEEAVLPTQPSET